MHKASHLIFSILRDIKCQHCELFLFCFFSNQIYVQTNRALTETYSEHSQISPMKLLGKYGEKRNMFDWFLDKSLRYITKNRNSRYHHHLSVNLSSLVFQVVYFPSGGMLWMLKPGFKWFIFTVMSWGFIVYHANYYFFFSLSIKFQKLIIG